MTGARQETREKNANNDGMEILLLGTAAAEAWPAPFCVCASCEEARKRGGRDIRTRAGALIDDDLKIDFGPDTVTQLQRVGCSLVNVKTIIFTHQHSDHIVPSELEWAAPPFTNTPPEEPIAVFGNDAVLEMLRAEFPDPASKNLAFHRLTPLETVTTPTGDTILPLPADHAPGALMLEITRNGRSVLYGHDSGRFPDETVAALANAPLDLALFDCTYGGQKSSNRGHLGIDGVLETIARLREVRAVTDQTTLVATHFSHNGGLLYDDLAARLAPHGVHVSFDGMMLNI